MKKTVNAKNLAFCALCIALCVVLPMAFHAIANAGDDLLADAHSCAAVRAGVRVAVWADLRRARAALSVVLTGMPGPAVLPGMMVECGVYGLVCGLMMLRVHTGKLYADLYISQITAMLLGRVLSGVCKALLFAPATFSIAAWATASFVTGLPGIIIQLVLLPSLVVALTKARLLRVRYA